ncbi:hypothetical protein ACFL3I_14685 [Pseudomonadota bacterium]
MSRHYAIDPLLFNQGSWSAIPTLSTLAQADRKIEVGGGGLHELNAAFVADIFNPFGGV